MPNPQLMVTVVVAHYNQAEFLGDCVENLLKNRSPYLKEVLIVDDHSTDIEYRDIVNLFEEMDKVTVLQMEKNSGVQAARNFGVFNSSSDLIINLDADDKIEPFIDTSKDLFNLCSEIMEDPEIAFIHFISDMFGDCEGYTISSAPLSENLVLRKFHVPTSICFRKSDFLSGARYDRKIRKWQDWSFGIELLSTRFSHNKINKIKFINKPYHKYRIHNSENRISMQNYSEIHFIDITVRRHLNYFRNTYGNRSPEEITKIVYESKPSKLIDLLYTAHFDLDIALKMVSDRKASLFSHIDTLGVP